MRVSFKVCNCNDFDSYILSEKLSGKEMNRVGLENIYFQLIMDIYIYRIDGSYFDSYDSLQRLFKVLEFPRYASGYIFNIYSCNICTSNFEKFKDRMLIELLY